MDSAADKKDTEIFEENHGTGKETVRRRKKAFIIITSIALSIVAFTAILLTVILPMTEYNKAVDLLNAGDYQEARKAFHKLGEYKDAADYYGRFVSVHQKETTVNSSGETETVENTYDSAGNLTKEIAISGDYQLIREYAYDVKGNLIEEKFYLDADLHDTHSYTYDTDGKLISHIITYYDDTGSIDFSGFGEYTYDANGNLERIVKTFDDNSKTYEHYTYDFEGNLTQKTYSDSISKDVFNYTYDAEGNLKKEVNTYSYLDRTYVYDHIYDDEGNLIKVVGTDSDGDTFLTEYTYDTEGNLIRELFTDSDGSQSCTEYSEFLVFYHE